MIRVNYHGLFEDWRMDEMNAPIGVFDSGVGGLTVVKEIMRQLPAESLVYFGDTARVPYGSKSQKTVCKYSKQIVRFLQTKQVKAIVVACNTASALALDEIRADIEIPIIGVVEPGAIMAANTTRTNNIGIIGTESTIKSGVYSKYLHKINPEITVVSKACPLFVPLVEEGLWEDRVTEDIAGRYLHEFKEYDIDSLILGCTHYPLLKRTIGREVGENVKLVNPAYETAMELKRVLDAQGILNEKEPALGENRYQFYVSDAAEKFKRFANSIIKYGILSAKTIPIEEY